MAGSDELTPFKAAATLLKWLDAIGEMTLPINLDLVRQMLPTTPFGKGAVLLEPAPVTWGSSEGALVRNPDNPNEWGIFYNDKARPERQRFTLADFYLARARRIQQYLSQNTYTALKFTGVEGSTVPVDETVEAFRRICDGEYDHIPEQAFFNIGGIEDLERAWSKLQTEQRR